MDARDLKKAAAAAIDAKRDVLFDLSDKIYANPEMGFEEHKAAAWISDLLESEGFSVERGVFGVKTAFSGRTAAKGKKPAIVFMAEYDALPIGHACGHNLIASAAVGAGLGLKAVLGRLGGEITVLGTPAEEGGGGKIVLSERGAFKGKDAALMIHPHAKTFVHMDKLEVQRLEFRYYGRSAHASAAPEQGINALDAAINTFVNINALRQQTRSDARIHGIIKKGGDKPNIIPEYAEAHFYVRALDGRYLDGLIRRVSACAKAGALAAGARLRIIREKGRYKGSVAVGPLLEAYRRNLELLGEEISEPPKTGGVGSSDFGNVSQELPAVHGYIKAAGDGCALHTHEFMDAAGGPSGRKALLQGAKSLAYTAIDLLSDPKLLAAVKADFKKRKKGT